MSKGRTGISDLKLRFVVLLPVICIADSLLKMNVRQGWFNPLCFYLTIINRRLPVGTSQQHESCHLRRNRTYSEAKQGLEAAAEKWATRDM
jgi:hypothetical protein